MSTAIVEADMTEHSEQRGAVAVTETPMGLAYRALLDHAPKCERCKANWRECPTRRALAKTLREVRA